jgi:pimeloyl-ACP methyl ester carboxylesterase
MAIARNGEITLWYDDSGAPDAPAVVIVPGTGRQATDSDLLRVALVSAGFRVLQMDNRDAGLSTPLTGMPANLPALFAAANGGPPAQPAYDARDMMRDILAVMDAAGVARAHLIGRSVGAMAAQSAAIDATARVASLVLVMSAARGVAELVTAERMASLEAEVMLDADGFAARQLAVARVNAMPQDVEPERIEAEARAAFARGVHPGGTARHYAVALALPDLRPQLSRLAVPTLVIHGAHDRVIPPAFGREIAGAVPGAGYLELLDMAHDGSPRVQQLWVQPILRHLGLAS